MDSDTTRQVIVHYHIFKNAGSTMDHILEKTFGEHWKTFDGSVASSRLQPEELVDFIRANPEIKAVSSHNLVFPVPVQEDIRIIPILFLRHPLDRIRSIYDFERRQGEILGPISKGAEQAARLSFGDYLQWRFDSSTNGVTHNYHTAWLLYQPKFGRIKIRPEDYAAALHTLEELPFFGLVERFDDSLQLIAAHLESQGMPIQKEYLVINSTEHRERPLEERLERLRETAGEELWAKLVERNGWDLKLYEAATNRFEERIGTSLLV